MNPTIKRFQDTVVNSAREVYYAGLGVVATLEQESSTMYQKAERRVNTVVEDAQDNFNQLAQKGQTFADRSEKALKGELKEIEGELKETRRDVVRYGDKAIDQLQDTVAAALNRLGIPTREEVRTLNANVEKLSAKVDQLRQEIQNPN